MNAWEESSRRKGASMIGQSQRQRGSVIFETKKFIFEGRVQGKFWEREAIMAPNIQRVEAGTSLNAFISFFHSNSTFPLVPMHFFRLEWPLSRVLEPTFLPFISHFHFFPDPRIEARRGIAF